MQYCDIIPVYTHINIRRWMCVSVGNHVHERWFYCLRPRAEPASMHVNDHLCVSNGELKHNPCVISKPELWVWITDFSGPPQKSFYRWQMGAKQV